MQKMTKWILGSAAALVVVGTAFAAPALAEQRGTAWMQQMMGSVPQVMSSMHQQMGGDMMAMHNAMAPLMGQMEAMHGQMMGEVATLFGMSAEELDAALAEGKTMAQLADEKGVAQGELQSLMTRGMKSFVDKAVEDGTITREQANQAFQFHQKQSTECLSGKGMGDMMGGMMGGQMGNMHNTMHGSKAPKY